MNSTFFITAFIFVSFLLSSCALNEDQKVDPKIYLQSLDISIGKNRIPFYIKRSDGSFVSEDPSLLSVIYYKKDDDAKLNAKNTKWRNFPLKSGIYVSDMEFDSTGIWIVEILFSEIKNPMKGQLIVKPKTDSPNIGTSAPKVKTKIINDSNSIETITSDINPDPKLYEISLDRALEKNIPILINLSTPGYCRSATCGPQTKILSNLIKDYESDKIIFIHIEIFDNPQEMKKSGDPSIGIQSSQVTEWKITTEPWTFLINNRGVIVERYEGFVSFEELQEDISNLLKSTN